MVTLILKSLKFLKHLNLLKFLKFHKFLSNSCLRSNVSPDLIHTTRGPTQGTMPLWLPPQECLRGEAESSAPTACAGPHLVLPSCLLI